MSQTPPFHPCSRKPVCKGYALVFVLAFVVILTGVVMAFFSRAISERMISDSSATQTKVELFAEGAADTILSDLKQEIEAGGTSTIGTIKVNGRSYTVRRPNCPATAAPCLALAGTSGIANTAFAPNLVKRSAYGQAFYSSSGTAIYSGTGPDRAAQVSSTTASLNGHSVSLARWNKPLFLPKATPTSDTDWTPVTTTGTAFVAPDWILVGRDGSNPTTLASATSSTSAVIGRYAYVIYNEGGVLDANAAGYPPGAGLSGTDVSYKNNLAFADLTQLLDASGNRLLTDADISALVGWRNYASAQATGDLQGGYSFIAASGSSYKTYAIANPKGFLTVSGSLNNGQGDKLFIGRHQFMDFLTQGVAGSSTDRARLQNALQYLGTFSRDWNQPSFAPDPTRPLITNTNNSGNGAYGADNDFNPAFLSGTVTSSFTRNDGTTAQSGEPLLAKRFNLNRLAWLTYKGPSSGRTMTDPDMQALQNYGITQAFLQLGTTENIQKYFGLSWDSTNYYWTYAHGIVGSGGTPIIGYLSKIAAANREPDFFELLKTFLHAGSLAKGATKPTGGYPEENYNFAYDTKLDYAIFQIGVNIIDQFKVDGFPTRIRFNDGTKMTEFRGVQNLPYLYKMREGVIVHRLPAPVTGATNTVLTDTGFYSILWQPEIWNPHGKNSSPGNPRPTDLRIVADGTVLDPDGKPLIGNQGDSNAYVSTYCKGAGQLDKSKTPASWARDIAAGGYASGTNWQWMGDNTALTFTDNGGTLFQEPTLLVVPDIPTGSNLALGPNNLIRTLFSAFESGTNLIPFGKSPNDVGILCINYGNDGTSGPAGSTATVGKIPFLGFYFGGGPVAFTGSSNVTSLPASIQTTIQQAASNSSYAPITFRMQCKDSWGNWVTYDEKLIPYFGGYTSSQAPGFNMTVSETGTTYNRSDSKDHIFSPAIGSFPSRSHDPRTRRFGFVGNKMQVNDEEPLQGQLSTSNISKTSPTGSRWGDVTNNVVITDRWNATYGEYRYPGCCHSGFPYVGGWTLTSISSTMFYYPGLISQNGTAAISGKISYYSDPDGIVRPAMGAYVTGTTSTIGLPMASTTTNWINNTNPPTQYQSRPIILHRPFRSVAELGYVFSGTPWKNLNMFTPESGDAALLDLFCIEADDTNTNPLVAGKVDLNTRQQPVLQAILAGAYKDELLATGTLAAAVSGTIANSLIARTSDNVTVGKGPLSNIAELVGRWNSATSSYTGFSADLSSTDLTDNNIQRFRESSMRALANAGTARVWTFMIDLIAQTGHYPANPGGLDKFVVSGERRYWLHVSIDRATGRVIDRQIEVITE